MSALSVPSSIAAALALAIAAPAAVAAPATYRVVELGTIDGLTGVAAINDADTVVGGSYLAAWRWTPAAGMQFLGSGSGTAGLAIAQAINVHGVVAGQAWNTASTAIDAVAWGPGGAIARVLAPADDGQLSVTGLNARGQAAGFAFEAGPERAVLWQPDGSRVDLGTLAPFEPDALAEAHGINDAGAIVGMSAGNHRIHAFAWTAARGMLDLGALPGQESSAAAINAGGVVVGNSQPHGFPANSTAIAWVPGTGMLALPALPAQSPVYGATASAVNAAGDIVGGYAFDNGGIANGRPCIWIAAEGYAAYDLRDLIDPADPRKTGVQFYPAVGINAAGHVVMPGYDIAANGNRIYMLVPETP